MNRPATPWTLTFFAAAWPTGIGIGSVVAGSPMARICAARAGDTLGCESRYAWISDTDAPSEPTVGAFATPMTSVLPVWSPEPYTTMIAGPPVNTSVLPSSFAGIGGAVRPTAAALARASEASKTHVAVVRASASYFAVVPIDAGSATEIAGRPVSAVAAPRLATGCGCGCADQVI